MIAFNQIQAQVKEPSDEEKIKNQIIKDFKTFQITTNEEFSDFKIFVGKEKTIFYAHKVILNKRSFFFEEIFKQKPDLKEIEFPQIQPSIMENILIYIYKTEINFEEKDLIDFWAASFKFQLPILPNILEKQINQKINKENVIKIISLNQSVKSELIEESCLNFISNHPNDFLKDEKVFDFSENQMNKIKTNIKKQSERVIDAISLLDKWKDPKSNDDSIENLKENQKQIKEILDSENQKQEKNKDSLINENKLKKPFENSTIINDLEYMQKLKEWLDDDFYNRMKLGFSAKKDGFTSKDFHRLCDSKPALVVIKTTENYIFGGFTQTGWTYNKFYWHPYDRHYSGGCLCDSNPFLYTLKNPKNDPPQKFPLRKGEEQTALYYHISHGPFFGAGNDLFLHSDLQPGFTDLGYSYHLPKGLVVGSIEAQSYLAGSPDQWKVEELECYFL
ncbi:e3 ubiquitin-protein ligase trim33-like [Anaeramoeba ignava]|uniref:E3 ubiquitin-protein ligase trim33-like n=1 Tax=Anaeramoeba ignava TaxID=1746090 RepID=A0A9Q0LAB4_ANAIG|nr:e3 ubiquitin-protein ligase trim33-like [Anaeramoeba ignava]